MLQEVILVAAGGLAREVKAAIEAGSTCRIIGFLDDKVELHGVIIDGVAVLGGIDVAVKYADAKFVVCAGSGTSRQSIVSRMTDAGIGSDRYFSVVHPSVGIPGSCHVGVGAVILAQVVLTANVTVGDHVVVMPHAVMTHDTIVEDFVTLCSGVLLGGGVKIGRAAYLGMGSSIREGVRVGELGVLGMGAVLLVDLPANEVWIGVPAKPMISYGTPKERDAMNLAGIADSTSL